MQIDPRWTGRAHPRVLRLQSDRMQWLHPRENLWGRTMRRECQPSFLVVRYRLCSFILLRWTTVCRIGEYSLMDTQQMAQMSYCNGKLSGLACPTEGEARDVSLRRVLFSAP